MLDDNKSTPVDCQNALLFVFTSINHSLSWQDEENRLEEPLVLHKVRVIHLDVSYNYKSPSLVDLIELFSDSLKRASMKWHLESKSVPSAMKLEEVCFCELSFTFNLRVRNIIYNTITHGVQMYLEVLGRFWICWNVLQVAKVWRKKRVFYIWCHQNNSKFIHWELKG